MAEKQSLIFLLIVYSSQDFSVRESLEYAHYGRQV